ncbi:hypothetical protein ACFSCZ_09755 [Siminovitchia sediminis]|uniref:Uncharacterized protein n=1 Tax=Siminovitchia sediminis TaxID=1274353 RepID=A0ABW4KG75_9BACI
MPRIPPLSGKPDTGYELTELKGGRRNACEHFSVKMGDPGSRVGGE